MNTGIPYTESLIGGQADSTCSPLPMGRSLPNISLTHFCMAQPGRNNSNASGGDTVVNKIDKNVCAHGADILVRRHRQYTKLIMFIAC